MNPDTQTQIEQIINHSRDDEESLFVNPQLATRNVIAFLLKQGLLVLEQEVKLIAA